VLYQYLARGLLYGCIGLLIEVFFTGFHSLFIKHWKATGYTYVWMLFPYGFAGLALEGLSTSLAWPFYLKALVYVPIFYGVEGLYGWTLMKVTGKLQEWLGGSGGGVVPWDYGKSKWSPMGLINLKFAPFWLALALSFDGISAILRRVVAFVATMY